MYFWTGGEHAFTNHRGNCLRWTSILGVFNNMISCCDLAKRIIGEWSRDCKSYIYIYMYVCIIITIYTIYMLQTRADRHLTSYDNKLFISCL